ncbi:hypothetical protein [Streptomyces sp. NPDC047000]|uniref:hypothetical protein n=1 Tax=Streptomyces sp. NPDC047000 TaxID=3155474 RepID=UPI0033C39E4C
MPHSCPPEFRRKILDLVGSGHKVAEVAQLLRIGAQTICVWRRRRLIDAGRLPGTTPAENAEPATARRRIAGLPAEVEIQGFALGVTAEVGTPGSGRRRFR